MNTVAMTDTGFVGPAEGYAERTYEGNAGRNQGTERLNER